MLRPTKLMCHQFQKHTQTQSDNKIQKDCGLSLESYLQLAHQSSKYPIATVAGTNKVWKQQKQFKQKKEITNNSMKCRSQTKFNQSEIKFETKS
jgi:hypothetical protein